MTIATAEKIIELHKPCPICDSSDAYCVYEDGHGYCFSCEHYTHPAKRKLDDEQEFTYEFLPWRGVEASTFRTFKVQTKVDHQGKPVSVGFRYPNGDRKVRSLDSKDFHWVKSGSEDNHGLFGQDVFAAGSHKYVIITEGELDACSLWQVTKVPCVSVSSATGAVRDCTGSRTYLNSFERIYLAFDSDASGREACQRVARLFDYNRLWQVKFSNRKDANEYLQHGEDDELRNIFWNSKRYLPDSIISSQEEFVKVLREEPKWGVPYPFPTLTEMTYGIRKGESVLLTAQEGVGKTELMHAIEYQILKETDDNVGAIFLEEPERRHLQALAGVHLKRPVHLPDSGVTSAEVIRAIGEIVPMDDRLHVYRHFGSDDPEQFLDTIRFLAAARACGYILVDHISMVCSGMAEEDERRKLDFLSTRLEMMVKELNYALIIVSHVNDLGQTRGSRYIGKIADIRIDAVRDLLSTDPVVRNTTYLSVSKNRYGGKTGVAGVVEFDPLTWTYTEKGHE